MPEQESAPVMYSTRDAGIGYWMLSEDEQAILEGLRDTLAHTARVTVTGLTAVRSMPLRAAENAVADVLTALVEDGWGIGE